MMTLRNHFMCSMIPPEIPDCHTQEPKYTTPAKPIVADRLLAIDCMQRFIILTDWSRMTRRRVKQDQSNHQLNHQFAILSIYRLLKVGGYHLSMPCHAGSCLCNASTL